MQSGRSLYVRFLVFIAPKLRSPRWNMASFGIAILTMFLFGNHTPEVIDEAKKGVGQIYDNKLLAFYRQEKARAEESMAYFKKHFAEFPEDIAVREKRVELLSLIIAARERGERDIFAERAWDIMLKEEMNYV